MLLLLRCHRLLLLLRHLLLICAIYVVAGVSKIYIFIHIFVFLYLISKCVLQKIICSLSLLPPPAPLPASFRSRSLARSQSQSHTHALTHTFSKYARVNKNNKIINLAFPQVFHFCSIFIDSMFLLLSSHTHMHTHIMTFFL